MGTELYVVALEEDVDEAELQSIATYPPGKYLVQKDFYNDDNRVTQLTLYRICNLPDPTPAPPSKPVCISTTPGDNANGKLSIIKVRTNQNFDNSTRAGIHQNQGCNELTVMGAGIYLMCWYHMS